MRLSPPPPPRLSPMLQALLLLQLLVAAWPPPAAAEQAADTAASANALPVDPRFFLKQIFEKYGDGGVMSYEGFEHLLESLGLGRLAFDKRHSVALHRDANGSFQEVHDLLNLHAHDHAQDLAQDTAEDLAEEHADEHEEPPPAGGRERRSLAPEEHSEEPSEPEALPSAVDAAGEGAESAPPPCLSPQDILTTFGLQPRHDVVISPSRFLRMCPVIVYELDQRSCFRAPSSGGAHSGHGHAHGQGQAHGHGHGHGDTGAAYRPDAAAWWRATLSVAIVSAAGLVAAAAAGPMLAGTRLLPVLEFLAAAGAGTLVGDALMHLLPHAMMGSHGADPADADHREPVLRAAAAVFTVIAFFALEQLLRRLNAQEAVPEKGEKDVHGSGMVPYEERDARGTELHAMLDMGESGAGAGAGARHSPAHGHSHGQAGAGDSVGAVAWMVILGDGVHNLTDGLAIGAAFSNDPVAGFATALAVFCHELPHEFGDFAVLLKSGMSLRNALLYNLFSSILSFLGMAIGVWIGNYESAAQWIYSATAGSFLYIALADLIPEMSRNADNPHTTLNTCLHLIGLLTGGGIMLAIGLYEDNLRSMFD